MIRRIVILGFALVLVRQALAGDWLAWRGPTGCGVATEKNLPVEWGREKNVRWRVPLP